MPPDPPHSDQSNEENLPSSPDQAVVLEISSSESSSEDEDDFVTPGYVQLPQEIGAVDDDNECSVIPPANIESFPSIKDQRETIMAPEQADLIKATMAKLPPPKAPQWAQTVPEEKWMGQIIAKIFTPSTQHATASHENNFANFDQHFTCGDKS